MVATRIRSCHFNFILVLIVAQLPKVVYKSIEINTIPNYISMWERIFSAGVNKDKKSKQVECGKWYENSLIANGVIFSYPTTINVRLPVGNDNNFLPHTIKPFFKFYIYGFINTMKCIQCIVNFCYIYLFEIFYD